MFSFVSVDYLAGVLFSLSNKWKALFQGPAEFFPMCITLTVSSQSPDGHLREDGGGGGQLVSGEPQWVLQVTGGAGAAADECGVLMSNLNEILRNIFHFN